MKIQFEPNLQYQIDTIHSVVSLFDGAPYIKPEDRVFSEVSSNVIKIRPDNVFQNFRKIAKQNGVLETYRDENTLDFSLEMETGTGKTYVYLRTIFELNKQYGLNKFIVVVPSIPVKEGVIKTLQMTESHFKELFNLKADYFEYDSKKPVKVRNFATSNTLQIMVTNTQAFNTDDRIINQERDVNHGVKLIDLIKQTNPIIIMDEPQEGMDSANMRKRFAGLNPLFKLRYSATHKNPVNLLFRLTPYDAYNQGLVKKIEVFSIHESNTQSNVRILFDDIKLQSGKLPEAKLDLSARLADGTFKEKKLTIRDGDDLEQKTNNPVYKGWVVSRILKDPLDGTAKIKFTNGTEITKGSKLGWDKESIFREQIRWTIKKHFQKKESLKDKGIKVISLLFIDRVANYVEENGIIKRLFREIYNEEYKNKYGEVHENIDIVHNGYFAKTGKGEYTDNENSMSKNSEIFNLIMKDKERLLSFDEPLEFIFSHSALGVGWDNPNVFNICTLNESESTVKKRQEIGRGLRLAVMQDGKRYRDSDETPEGQEVNLLTVVANQSYYAFANSYQQELFDEYGDSSKTIKPRNARIEPNKLRLKKEVLNSDDFQGLWKKISTKTKYSVVFRENELIDKCATALDEISLSEQKILIDLNRITSLSESTDISQNTDYVGGDEVVSKSNVVSIDIVDELSEATALSINTVIQILNKMQNKHLVNKNPVIFLTEATKKICEILDTEMVSLVSYQSLQDSYDTSLFKEIIETFGEVVPTRNGLYDGVTYDSEVEKSFALDVDNENKVKAFLKLPRWYEIDTPIGKYNPDFALVLEKGSLDNTIDIKYYFVIETKGSKEWNQLKESEKMKIQCAIKHFEAIGLEEYLAPVESFSDFKQKVNNKLDKQVF
jgi:type III restriction enzyme